jgi:hypothetical protein
MKNQNVFPFFNLRSSFFFLKVGERPREPFLNAFRRKLKPHDATIFTPNSKFWLLTAKYGTFLGGSVGGLGLEGGVIPAISICRNR